jgi:hypothetical protein
MKSTTRSASGALLMLAIIPGIVGLLACMPVPIGDPERSRIDPEISGVWMFPSDEQPAFYAFEPYDKRTWLLSIVPIERGKEADLENYELSKDVDFDRLIENESVGKDGATATSLSLYKVWRTKLGGEWFMTLEPKADFENESFSPEIWFVFGIGRPDENELSLRMVGGDLFKDVEETRRAFERVIKKNARNEELYDKETMRLVRLKPEHLDFFGDLVGEVIKD